MTGTNSIASAMQQRRTYIAEKWAEQLKTTILSSAKGRIAAEELYQQGRDFLDVFYSAVQSGKLEDIHVPEWAEVRSFLED
ncbi:MAG: RsbT co-antagonist protein rsbRD N-terminal domain, partial [Gammaproteobacteria bacterium]|nr:RsbT co-antagonist protein rsbRD N-terminal domain [Gammaproteobacteria bacterium]